MARMELNVPQAVAVRRAREAVAVVRQLDWTDDLEMARTIGRLKATVEALLEIFDEEER